MFASPSRRVDQPAAAANGMARRHLLSGWDIGELVDMKYSYGLTGVDQKGNYLC
jgi:hypothetical protein